MFQFKKQMLHVNEIKDCNLGVSQILKMKRKSKD